MCRPLAAFAVFIACVVPVAALSAFLSLAERPAPAAAAENPPDAKPASSRKAAVGRLHPGDIDANVKLPKLVEGGRPGAAREIELRPLPSDGRPRVDRPGAGFRPQRSRSAGDDLLRLPRRKPRKGLGSPRRGIWIHRHQAQRPHGGLCGVSRRAGRAGESRSALLGLLEKDQSRRIRSASTATVITTSKSRPRNSPSRPSAPSAISALRSKCPRWPRSLSRTTGSGRCCERCRRKTSTSKHPVPERFHHGPGPRAGTSRRG